MSGIPREPRCVWTPWCLPGRSRTCGWGVAGRSVRTTLGLSVSTHPAKFHPPQAIGSRWGFEPAACPESRWRRVVNGSTWQLVPNHDVGKVPPGVSGRNVPYSRPGVRSRLELTLRVDQSIGAGQRGHANRLTGSRSLMGVVCRRLVAARPGGAFPTVSTLPLDQFLGARSVGVFPPRCLRVEKPILCECA